MSKQSEKMTLGEKFINFKAPHTYTIITCVVLFAFALCWILPAGEFERVYDPISESDVVVPGSYQLLEKDPPGFFDIFTAVQVGYIQMADILFFVFFAYAFVFMLTKNGTIDAIIGLMLRKLQTRISLIIPVSMIGFGLMGSIAGIYEEIYGLVPIFVGIAIAIGYDGIVGGAIAITGTATGFAAATINPFSLGIAQGLADVPLYSGMSFRIVTFIVFQGIAIAYVMRYAAKIKKNPEKSHLYGIDLPAVKTRAQSELMELEFSQVHFWSSIIFAGTIGAVIVTTLVFGWYINELAGLFLLMLIVTGFVSRNSYGQIMDIYVEGAQNVLFGMLTIGFTRAAIVLMEDTHVLDTITNFFANILVDTSAYTAAIGMLVVQYLIDFFITGGPAQAVATMPIMAPLADLIGLNRQIAIQAYVFGSGFADMLWPTCVALDCAIMGLPIAKWYKFIVPLVGIMFVVQVIFMIIAILINYS